MPEAVALIRKEDEEQLVKAGDSARGYTTFFTKKSKEWFSFQNNNFDGRKWIVYTA